MRKISNKIFSVLMVMVVTLSNFLPFIPKVYASEIIDEISVTSDTTSVVAGSLPSFEVATTTDHIDEIEAYGSNTGWSKWEEGYSSWHGFGIDEPVAINDGTTHYALRLSVKTDFGYQFGDDVTIYFNGVNITHQGHTLLDNGFNWGGYLYIDLGTAIESNTHRVDFDTDGGTPMGGVDIQDGDLLIEPLDPVKEGFTFDGWYSDDQFTVPFDFNTPITEDITLFAKWDQAKYTITLDPNNGTSETNSIQNVVHGQNVGLGTPESYGFTIPEGKEFDGWMIGGARHSAGQTFNVTSNLVAIADWRDVAPNMHTVTFDTDGGTPMGSRNIADGDLLEEPQVPVKDGYTFGGWYLDDQFTVPFDFSLPITNSFTLFAKWDESNESSYTVSFSAEEGHTMAVVDGHLQIDEQFVDLRRGEDTIGNVACNSSTSCSITVSGDEPVVLNYNHADKFTLYNSNGHVPYEMDTEINSNTVFFVEDFAGNEQNVEDIEFDINWTNSYVNMWINDKSVMEESQDFTSHSFVYNGVIVENAGYTDPAETNVIKLQTRFGDNAVTEYTINGQVYNAQSENVVIDNEDAWFITVPGANKYTVSGIGTGDAIRTIIWANVDADKNAEGFEDDMILEHGTAKIIAVYDEEDHQVAGEIDVDPETGMGWIPMIPGYKVLFEFVPEYGYQLTSVKANGMVLEPQDSVNQYMFEMPDTNVHFQAIFKQTKDIVNANSSKVSGGSISLGEELEGGSARLTVKDAEIDSSKIKGFEEKAGDYKISSYLDIDLYNIFYKGKDDANDVWSNKIDELDKEATITIKLADDVNADDIVIVHNIHDGDEYEIIKIDSYDRETNTITFRTKSFSNYAIATKGSGERVNNPKTFDGIIMWVSLLIISLVGVGAFTLKLKRQN